MEKGVTSGWRPSSFFDEKCSTFFARRKINAALKTSHNPPAMTANEEIDMSIENKVIEIIADNLDVPVAEVTPEKSFDDLGADSLAVVELVMAFEDEFDIEVEEEDAQSLLTVKQTIDFLTKLKG